MFRKTQKIISSEELRELYPVEDRDFKVFRDNEIKDILGGKINKFLAIVGPCSLNCEDGTFDYLRQLKKIEESVGDKILIVPRLFSAKPRTMGTGYRGLLHEKDGFIKVRKILTGAINDFGLSGADELLYPFTYEYFCDAVSYYTIGARSSLNQEHRFFASGIDVAVGIKNAINGDLRLLNGAVEIAKNPLNFYYEGQIIEAGGNPYAHAILRGYQNNLGKHFNNMKGVEDLSSFSVVLDLGHSNAKKDCSIIEKNYNKLLKLLHNKNICGIMFESYLKSGRSDRYIFGQSITDECIGLDDTKRILLDLCERLS